MFLPASVRRLLPMVILVLVTVTLTGALPLVTAQDLPAATAVSGGPGPVAIVVADPDKIPGPAIPPPTNFLNLMSANRQSVEQANEAAAGGITVIAWNGSWPAAAQNAFLYAVAIWNSLIQSSTPVEISATWGNLGTGILGGAGASTIFRDGGLPVPSTWYSAAETNVLIGSDILGPGVQEINATFNSAFPSWYFGTDGNPGAGQYDFVSVVLHEIGHGLGFFGSMDVDDGVSTNGIDCNNAAGYGCWGFTDSSGDTFPVIYDRFTENSSGSGLLNTAVYPNPSLALGSVLRNIVYFDGPDSRSANCGARVQLYTPTTWSPGSSYSHVGELFNNTADALMTYSLGPGEVQHSPGPITLGMFTDMDWPLIDEPPVIATLPGQLMLPTEVKPNAIDLLAYTTDTFSANCQMSFAIVNTPNPQAGVSLVSGRYISIDPVNTVTYLATDVVVQATDGSGQSTTQSFRVVITNNILRGYLPLIETP